MQRKLLTDSARARLWVKTARMYHEEHMGQPEIAERLNLSQSQISRLLREAQDNGVVRTLVVTPPGLYVELEEDLRRHFGLRDAVVADAANDEPGAVTAAIGIAAAAYFEATVGRGERIGVSSRSTALQSMVDAMTPVKDGAVERVVQSLGAIGNASVRAQASGLTDAVARLTGAEPVYLSTPGVLTSRAVRDGLLDDEHIDAAVAAWRTLTTLLTGIGSMQAPDAPGGDALAAADIARLRSAGAVGDVCLNFFDADGSPVRDELRDRVIGISEADLEAVPRRIGVAGGPHKLAAITAACAGGWVNVLVTDQFTARRISRRRS